jgi:hypothetical protein
MALDDKKRKMRVETKKRAKPGEAFTKTSGISA